MILQTTVAQYIPTNAYFYSDDDTHHSFLIDPGAEADKLIRVAKEHELVVDKILLTHGHFDHMGAVIALQQKWGIPVCMQANGRAYADNPDWNLSAQTNVPIRLKDVTYLEDDTDVNLEAAPEHRLHIVPVPGHTTDGCVYYNLKDNVAFVGDSVFLNSYGRTDMPGGSEETLLSSIAKEILTLPADMTLLSGHSEPTTVAAERRMPWYGPYLNKD